MFLGRCENIFYLRSIIIPIIMSREISFLMNDLWWYKTSETFPLQHREFPVQSGTMFPGSLQDNLLVSWHSTAELHLQPRPWCTCNSVLWPPMCDRHLINVTGGMGKFIWFPALPHSFHCRYVKLTGYWTLDTGVSNVQYPVNFTLLSIIH